MSPKADLVRNLLAHLDTWPVGLVVLDRHWAGLWLNRAAREGLDLPAAGVEGPARADEASLWSRLPGLLEALRAMGARQRDERFSAVLRGIRSARPEAPPAFDAYVDSIDPALAADLAGQLHGQLPAYQMVLVDVSSRLGTEAELAQLRGTLQESERARQRLASLQQELVEDAAPEMIGSSAGLRRVKDQVARVAPTDTTVLIHGETGSGKELVARAIHASSRRAGQAFVAVNCAALPESLIESELFGHERGAFTGADRRRLGKFELADGGTLFLDEIAELPQQAQAKLLRVIQESAFERVGGAETVKVNVRILAATHRDLARQVERARFREDLFYRLNVFKIDVPPLRDRAEDLKALALHLHRRFAQRMGKSERPLSDVSLRRLMAYAWPGNVRELANAVERATLLAEGPTLEIEIPDGPLPDGLPAPRPGPRREGGDAQPLPGQGRSDILLDLTLEQLQRLQITHALESCGYRVFGAGGAAQRLDLNPNTLLAKMDKFGIPRPRLMRRARRPGQPADRPPRDQPPG
jgi:transcriptional regulator with GAF, ATPase, and Fis domain